jgi:hypothetical protein
LVQARRHRRARACDLELRGDVTARDGEAVERDEVLGAQVGDVAGLAGAARAQVGDVAGLAGAAGV